MYTNRMSNTKLRNDLKIPVFLFSVMNICFFSGVQSNKKNLIFVRLNFQNAFAILLND